MQRTLVIGDIHGELAKLKKLLKKTNYIPKKDQLILLGDYVDRGGNASGVLDYIMTLRKDGAIALMGNHEQLMLESFSDKKKAHFWLHNVGGAATLKSYGYSGENIPLHLTDQLSSHLQFISTLPLYEKRQNYLFVHAGINPTLPFTQNDSHDFLWIRQPFHEQYVGEEIVIFGHTPTNRLHNDETNHDVYFGKNNIIGIDGGAVFGGKLHCLELPSQTIYSV